jgi:hypothetical protein
VTQMMRERVADKGRVRVMMTVMGRQMTASRI